MAITVQQMHPVAHLPWVLGILRRLRGGAPSPGKLERSGAPAALAVSGHHDHEALRGGCGRAEEPGGPPASGHSHDGRDALQQGRLRLGVSGDGGLPLRIGLREDNCSDSVETPRAIEEGLAWGWDGVRGIVADRKA